MRKFSTDIGDSTLRACRTLQADGLQRLPGGSCQHTLAEPGQILLTSLSEIVATVEVGYVQLCLQAAERLYSDIPNENILKHLEKDFSSSIDKSWDSRLTFCKKWFGYDARSKYEDAHKHWFGYIEVRNAWMHGRGELTRRQIGNQSIFQGAPGVVREGSRVKLKSDALKGCVQVGEEILWTLEKNILGLLHG